MSTGWTAPRVEVVRSYLVAAAEEMRATLIRTAFNPVIYEVLDFGISIYDADMRLIAEAHGADVLPRRERLLARQGCGVRRAGRTCTAATWCCSTTRTGTPPTPPTPRCSRPSSGRTDEHGSSGSCASGRIGWTWGQRTRATCSTPPTCTRKGCIFPGTKVVSRGEPVHEIIELIRFNSRMPAEVLGDLHAQIAALRTGERRLIEILRKFGRDTVAAAVQRMIDDGAARSRAALDALPQGSWTAVDWLDDDGIGDGAGPDAGDRRRSATASSSSTSPARRQATAGPINMPFGATEAICKVVLKSLTSPDQPSNDGHRRCRCGSRPSRARSSTPYTRSRHTRCGPASSRSSSSPRRWRRGCRTGCRPRPVVTCRGS